MLDMEQRSQQQHAPPPAAEPAQAAQQQQQEEGEPQHVAGEAAAAVHQPEAQAAAGAPEAALEAPGLSVAPHAPVVAAPTEGEEGLRQRRAAMPAGVPAAPAPVAPLQQQAPPPAAVAAPQQPLQWQAPVAPAVQHPPPSFEDRLLTWLAILLVAAILALVARRLLGGVVVGDGGMAGHGLDSQL